MAKLPSSPNRMHTEDDNKELLAELQSVQKRLAAKVEALLAVSEDLAKCQLERDKWQTVAQNYERNLSRLESTFEKEKEITKQRDRITGEEKLHQTALVKSLREENEKLLQENTMLQIELKESKGDSKMLRQKLARHQLKEYYNASEDSQSPHEPLPTPKSRLGSQSSVPGTPTETTTAGRNASSAFFSSPSNDQQTSLEDFEKLREQYAQLERDLRSILCEKEELICERDTYKTKVDRLSQELGFMMNGDERRIVTDLDSLVAENRYLKAQLTNAQEETGLARAALNRYRSLVEKRKNRAAAAGGGKEGGGGSAVDSKSSDALTVVTPKQVVGTNHSNEDFSTKLARSLKNLFHRPKLVVTNSIVRDLLGMTSSAGSEETTDYKALATALFDAVNDKQLALTHQRKANKILGGRMAELEAIVQSINEAKSPTKHRSLTVDGIQTTSNNVVTNSVDTQTDPV